MQYLRTFVAVEISPEVRARAGVLMDIFRGSGAKTTWTKSQNLHLTLKFLGDTSETLIPDVCRAVLKAAAKVEPFELHFTSVGVFPSLQKPQTLWLGINEGLAEIRECQMAVEEALFALRYPKERRPYAPHLTLGRMRAGSPEQLEALRQLLTAHAKFDAGVSIVEEILVVSSTLDRATGPTYEVLARAELA